jgi:hypothetical protein
VAAGATFNDDGGINIKAGHVRVYRYNDGSDSWSQYGSDINGSGSRYLSVSLAARVRADRVTLVGGRERRCRCPTTAIRWQSAHPKLTRVAGR